MPSSGFGLPSHKMTGMAENDDSKEIEALRTEIERLRVLVGPNEDSYVKLQLDLLGARDAAIAAEAEVGVARGHSQLLMTELARSQRDFVWFREQVITRAKALHHRRLGVSRVIGRRSSR